MFVFRLISYLPLWVLYIFSDCFYLVAYYIVGYRKKVVWKNLQHAFPEKTDQELKKIMREFYRNLTDSFAETIKLMTMGKAEIAKRFQLENMDLLRDLLKKEQVIVGLTAHFFNWEGHPLSVRALVDERIEIVYQKVTNPFFENLMKTIRSRFGGYLVEKSKFQRHFIKHRLHPRLIGLAADQRPNREDQRYHAKFMHRETGFFEGAEKIAKRFELTVIFSEVHKLKRGHYKFTYRFVAEPPHDTREHSITDQFIALTEKNIREEPALYLWSHNRWKNS
ncbi:lipid A biosynthesis acyltransferase [Echinicola strongylocentroti]|uniref:Lipid A biosynthesis acyltransferase n=1 Tax=Echinicola strongylocentroti TaxID=1795355 RepID=A0A2Z4IHN3_9BACT|nr:lysophospholipid acyltransferase family protein [Echinicola strongylocentroti]AWW30066.1 lipid A biosynthesis acyltransferase [Echinicola strongylocentroti]